MTVHDLQEKLRKFSPDAVVVLEFNDPLTQCSNDTCCETAFAAVGDVYDLETRIVLATVNRRHNCEGVNFRSLPDAAESIAAMEGADQRCKAVAERLDAPPPIG